MKLTELEIGFLKSLNKEWNWIIRDRNGFLILCHHKPYKKYKENDEWRIASNIFAGFSHIISNDLFQFIKSEDEEPYSIEELLKGNKTNEN